MGELAQELIKSRTASNSWSLQSYPGKVKLPSDILRALPSPEAANKVIIFIYLQDAVPYPSDLGRFSKRFTCRRKPYLGLAS